MKPELRKYLAAILTVGFVILSGGCETLQPHGFVMAPLQDHGGGGGDN